MVDIIRAWKDPAYRSRLGSLAPPHPAGMVELTDDQLKMASGASVGAQTTCQCCTDTSRFRRCCP
jgi:mersacidin/lichenicidin family type 2 lantibiotic